MSIKITDIAFTGTPVRDMKKARAFYEGILGLVPAHVFEHEGTSWVEYNIGPAQSTLAITDGNLEWKPSAEGTAIAFEVENFDEAIAHLKANNITILGDAFDTPVCRIAIISDPDGNSVTIHKCKHAHQ